MPRVRAWSTSLRNPLTTITRSALWYPDWSLRILGTPLRWCHPSRVDWWSRHPAFGAALFQVREQLKTKSFIGETRVFTAAEGQPQQGNTVFAKERLKLSKY